MKYHATLERTSDVSAIRTPVVVGFAKPPVVGLSFDLIGKSLTPGLPYRSVMTSCVMVVSEHVEGNHRIFEIITRTGSRYIITIHGPPISSAEIDSLLA